VKTSVVYRALVFGGIVLAAVAIIGSVVGLLVAGLSGLVSALFAAGLTALFLGFTTLSILLAQRVTRESHSTGAYFGIILGMWVFKFIVFVVVLLATRGADWLNPFVFFYALIAAVLGSLIADIVALSGAQVSAVPSPPAPSADAADGSPSN
jgi:hypothetical protein